MRALALVLAMSTGCSFALSETPGPRCVESGTDIADGLTAATTGLLALIAGVAAADECGNGCSNSEDRQLVISAVGLALTTVGFTLSAIHGAKQNAACRKARGQTDTDE